MTEIFGKLCENFVAVSNQESAIYSLFYMTISGVSHRFFLDAGALFWSSGMEPDEDDDLLEGDVYVDFAKQYDLAGSRIESIDFANDLLRMRFANGVRLNFACGVDECGGRLIDSP
ncbi:MAG: hypothetical protein ACREB7_04510 [Sphingopyxis sp.]|uniref:hypothetical protein n=1 Tax=Sphingopyxis sp. TaxID=1908224 RepID=UPI003D6D55CE